MYLTESVLRNSSNGKLFFCSTEEKKDPILLCVERKPSAKKRERNKERKRMSVIGVYTEDGNIDVIRNMIISHGLKRGTAMLTTNHYLDSVKSFIPESFIHRSFNQNTIDRIVLFQRSLVKTSTQDEKSVPMFFILESRGGENESRFLEDIVKDSKIILFLLKIIPTKKPCPLRIAKTVHKPISCEVVGDDQYRMVGEWYSRKTFVTKKSCCSFFKFW